MTRFIRTRFLLPAAAVVALILGTSTMALAGGNPTPAQTFQLPQGQHDQQFHPEAFDILLSSLGDNNVDAYGPVAGLGGTDREVTGFLDVWNFGQGNTANVLHQAEPMPVLDLQTCTATVVLHDGWWKFAGGTGDDDHAKGMGKFTEVALFSFAIDRHGRCEFDQQGQMMDEGSQTGYGEQPWMKDHNRDLRPLFWSVEIQGTGLAKVRHHEEQPCPPDVYGGQPSGAPMPSCTSPAPYPSPSPISTSPSPYVS